MSKAKHTKGPWEVQVQPHGKSMVEVVIAAKCGEVCFFNCHANDKYMGDARLIAAAPELLEALDGMLQVYGGNKCCDGLPRHATELDLIAQARAAIAKATGEQP